MGTKRILTAVSALTVAFVALGSTSGCADRRPRIWTQPLPAGVDQVLAERIHIPVPGEFISEVLPNGLRVTILPDPRQPVVSTQVWYHVGSANESSESRGLAHLFEHLMFGETVRYSKGQYIEYHRRYGGKWNAYTGVDETVFWSQIAPEYHEEVLKMEADRMMHLVLSQGILDDEKKIVTEELRRGLENDPITRLIAAARRAVLLEHPYAYTPFGTKEDIARATLQDCRGFYDRFYGPRNAHLVIVGPVDGPAILATARKAFGAIPDRGNSPPAVPSLLDHALPEEIELEEDIPSIEVALVVFPLPPSDADDIWALQVMVELLCGRSLSPFKEELVTFRRKALEAGALVLWARRGGMIVFYSASLPYRRKTTAFRLIEETLAEVAHPRWINEQSVRSARLALVRRMLRDSYFANRQASAIGKSWHWYGDGRIAFERAERVQAVTPQEVSRVFEKYVLEASPARIYVTPERVPLLVRLFGWLYPLFN